MASVNGLNRLGLPKLSENMDPEDARALRSYLYHGYTCYPVQTAVPRA